jgi:chaperonin cofactor prefoldin
VLIARTDKQDRKLRNRLQSLRDDLAALAAQNAETVSP